MPPTCPNTSFSSRCSPSYPPRAQDPISQSTEEGPSTAVSTQRGGSCSLVVKRPADLHCCASAFSPEVKSSGTSRYDQSMSSRICIYRCTLIVTVLTLMRHMFASVRIANVFGATREAGSHSPLNRPNKLVNHPTHAWSDSGQVVSSSQKKEAISI